MDHAYRVSDLDIEISLTPISDHLDSTLTSPSSPLDGLSSFKREGLYSKPLITYLGNDGKDYDTIPISSILFANVTIKKKKMEKGAGWDF